MEKKVLFVATVTRHINLFHIPYLKWFKEKGYEVHVASNGNECIEYCDKHYNLPFERSPMKKNNLKTYVQLKKIISNNDYNIIHCHTPVGSILTRLAARKERKKGTKVIYTAHGFHFFKGAPIFNWLFYYPIEKIMSKYTDCIITINEEDYNIAKKNFYCSIELVNGIGVDWKKFNLENNDAKIQKLKDELEIKKEDKVLIYAAELSDRKNQGMLLKVIDILNNSNRKIKVLLPGIDSKNGFYQQEAQKLGISQQVKFLGHRNDINELLQIADIAVSTSKQEGLPVNIIEAMITGIPVVATDCRGNRDLIKDKRNGFLIKLNDVKSFKDAIEKLLDDNLLYENFSKNNKKDSEKYRIEKIIKNMEKVYLQQMEENKNVL